MKTSKKGISLIVLVITIIVMIILATSIILSLSASDIRGKANEAVSSSDMATAKELVAIAQAEWELNYDELMQTQKYVDFKAYADEKLKDAGIRNMVASNKGAVNIVYEDKKGDTAIIPEGFNVSTVASEQTISDGLVIVDKEGNEFVWIPVDDYENRFKRTTKYKATEKITAPSSYNTEPYSYDLAITEANDPTGEYAEWTAMRASVKENGGFYIARYEAGLPEGKTTGTVTPTDKPVSKKGATVWNNIQWGKSTTNIGTLGAVYRARQMYKGSKSVVSTLCYGVQWDAALQFIATKDEDYAINSTGKGNYAGGLLTTGYRDDYAVNNIYDMAGNVWEWTMEANSASGRILRGGGCGGNGSSFPASIRSISDYPDGGSAGAGFRLTLYIK